MSDAVTDAASATGEGLTEVGEVPVDGPRTEDPGAVAPTDEDSAIGGDDPAVGEGPEEPAVESAADRPEDERLGGGAAEAEDELTDDLSRAQADVARAQQDVATLTADLQRLQAEYLNYKRRVDRDRDLTRENATYAVLAPITEVLDTIDRAREHGPLEDGLKAVAEQLERVVAGLGLIKFGEVGEPFDPTVHEALSHIGEDPDVEVTTCKVVARAGYRIGERVVRAAQVLVVDPATPAPEPGEQA